MKKKPGKMPAGAGAATDDLSTISTEALDSLLMMLGRALSKPAKRSTGAKGKNGKKPVPFSHHHFKDWLSRERYVYAEEIGTGGMSKVYRAADLHLCRSVAMKILPEGHREDDLCRFVHEAQITSQLQHPNIIPIYDCGIDPFSQQPFFTMKLIERGRSALDILIQLRKHEASAKRHFGNLSERINIILKVADALAYAHSRGVVHQDVKPANILVGDHGEVYVIDWGIAKVGEAKPKSKLSTGRLSFPKEHFAGIHEIYDNADRINDANFFGSPVHMAPEQFTDGNQVDGRADIYGFGCSLYEMITLHPPFDPLLPLDQLLTKKKHADYPDPTTYAPEVPTVLTAIVAKCLAPLRSKRYQKISQVQDDIQKAMNTMFDHRMKVAELRQHVRKVGPCKCRDSGKCQFYNGVNEILGLDKK